uniref:Ribonuclease H-like domain-containing protein n=1 Tax=Tanacetum cinerariifolium TaxID=118510 RepID=A0A6L2MTC9_TANCI|nr:ribonuclease H-like domain-containing protein [Tanacetum cinerariifolium]
MFLSRSKFVKEILKRTHMQHCNLCKTPIDTESKLRPDGDIAFYATFAVHLIVVFSYVFLAYNDVDWARCLVTHQSTSGFSLTRSPSWGRMALRFLIRPFTRALFELYNISPSLDLIYLMRFNMFVYICMIPGILILLLLRGFYVMFAAFWVMVFCSILPRHLLWLPIQMFIGHAAPLLIILLQAEYRGVAIVVAETSWLWNLLGELQSPLHSATIVYCDNVSAVYLSSNPLQHERTKHAEIDIHFIRDQGFAAALAVLNPKRLIVDKARNE